MFTRVSCVRSAAVALLLCLPVAAQATPIVTLSFNGTIGNGYDSSNLFGGGNLTGDSFSAALSFNPFAIGISSCGASTLTTSCNWSASGSSSFTESLVITAGGHDYVQAFTGATSSSLSLISSGNDAIYLNFGGPGFSISLNAVDLAKSGFFANDANANDLNLNFTDIALNPNSSAEYGNKDSTSFTLNFSKLSATTVSDATAIPEPGTLALFGAGLLGLLAFARGFRRLGAGARIRKVP